MEWNEIENVIDGKPKTKKVDVVLTSIKVKDIIEKDNVRSYYNDETMNELVQSIRYNGLKIPIIVSESKNKFHLVAGSRRLRAIKKLGETEIEAIIRNDDVKQNKFTNIIENLNRDDLTPIEVAKGITKLIDDVKMSKSKIAKKLGKFPSWVSAKLSLLTLPEWLQEAINDNLISEGHGVILQRLSDEKIMKKVYNQIQKENLTVEKTKNIVNEILEETGEKKESINPDKNKVEDKSIEETNKFNKTLETDDLDDDVEEDEFDEMDVDNTVKMFTYENLPDNIFLKVDDEGFEVNIRHNDFDDKQTFTNAMKFLVKHCKDMYKKIKKFQTENYK